MLDGGYASQTADVLRASHAARSGLFCMFWHVLRPTCIVAALKFGWCLKPHIPNIQNLKDGKSLCLTLSLSLSTLWQGLRTTTSVLRPQVMMRFSGRRAGRARRRNPSARSSPFSLLSKMCWPELKAITSPIQLTSCG